MRQFRKAKRRIQGTLDKFLINTNPIKVASEVSVGVGVATEMIGWKKTMRMMMSSKKTTLNPNLRTKMKNSCTKTKTKGKSQKKMGAKSSVWKGKLPGPGQTVSSQPGILQFFGNLDDNWKKEGKDVLPWDYQ